MIEENEKYLLPTEEYRVCIDCLADENLIANLTTVMEKDKCSFCDKFGPATIIENFFEEICEAINNDRWVRAVDCGSYDSLEGGFYQDTKELREVARRICEEAGVWNDKLLSFVETCFSDVWMIEKPFGHDFDDDYKIDSWQSF